MTNRHLSDAEIQKYVLQNTDCDVDSMEHIEHCTNCKIKAAQYKLLFEEIMAQEKPVFDFNLADLVTRQLLQSQQKVSSGKPFIYFIVFLFIICSGIGFYLFRSSLSRLTLSIAPLLTGLIITTVTCLSVFLCIDMYRKYKVQMKTLNFY